MQNPQAGIFYLAGSASKLIILLSSLDGRKMSSGLLASTFIFLPCTSSALKIKTKSEMIKITRVKKIKLGE